ncbi:DNA replication ATP-dependent helicase/nuclease DNA2 [Psilocybe cubensis]|uniref:DNA replication ATP-dependent helicase/nuclease DNA2 n=2 Tax=Psilocybe cubensis TaxID=181762 RepID=A0ACB8H3Q9_PSICU|nr:DNA replication ATP-dependent helicase/nuclease DNA2 [Psilocybe cubensis]KAH9482370.1 DNA replication ATP-dependent helicase/nuclease DNA2 [Psilocybe cubensis]
MAPTVEEEAAFMAQLMQGIDDDFWTAGPSPDPSPSKKKVATTDDHNITAFLENSENWDLDDFVPSPVKPPQEKSNASIPRPIPRLEFNQSPQNTKKPPLYIPDECTRCVVESVTETYVDSRWEKIVVANVLADGDRAEIHLLDDWYHTDIRIDDILNVIGAFSGSSSSNTRSIYITSRSNLLILHPDVLITATALSSAPQCRRRPLLSNMLRSTTEITPALIWGNMLHEVMQKCLLEQRWEEDFINSCIDDAIMGNLGDLVKLGLSEGIAKREVKDRAKGLPHFADKYLAAQPKSTAELTNTQSAAFNEPSLLAITDILEIEEDIWSPTYGIKGKVDATVLGTISDPSPSPFKSRVVTKTPLPLELKTGRILASMGHRAQTMLYTILLSERYGTHVQDGLLFYSQSENGEIVRIPRGRNEIRGLVNIRNELAAYMWRRIRKVEPRTQGPPDHECEQEEEYFLPAPIDDERECKRCYALDACMLFRKARPHHSDSSSTSFEPPIPTFLSSTFDAKTGHLTPTHTKFFTEWERLLALEEKDLVRFKRELWTLGAAEREKRGRCFSEMILVGDRLDNLEDKDSIPSGKERKIHRFTYVFRKSRPSATLINGHLTVGDAITVSVEPRLIALARGFILELEHDSVVVGVDHVLNIPGIKARLGREALPSPYNSTQAISTMEDTNVIFRIDKDELMGGMTRVRNNLAQLFYVDGDAKRLELVVDLRKPVFKSNDEFVKVSRQLHSKSALESDLQLNTSQLDAMDKVLSAEDYALILGMPGTGKTTVIAALIREFVARGKTVLLSSYTHSAVDTILRKVSGGDGRTLDAKGGAFNILRLGNVDKIHPELQKFSPVARRMATTVGQLEKQLMDAPVVATTCLSLDNPLFSRRKFDYCIVDEASQITLPTCLGPLKFADVFVLVGDHFQLPPLVKNPDARKGGLDVSLFRRLSEAYPESVVDLRFQYRMNEDIMMLSNKLIYNDRLQCGNDEVAKRSLVLRNKRFLGRLHVNAHNDDSAHIENSSNKVLCRGADVCWLEKLCDERCKAVFVDTDNLPAHESRVGDLVQNTTEAELVCQFIETLIRCGVDESQIGVISLYRQQVKILQNLLQERKGVEVLTADKSQGRDKDCVIVSLVRSNNEGNVGDLVKDWRRINVSFTRARSKLVIFGSRKTLEREPLLGQFFELMETQRWIQRLPSNAHTAHARILGGCTKVLAKRDGRQSDENILPEQTVGTEGHPTKKVKLDDTRSLKSSAGGVLKGRPILRDLVIAEV